MTGCISKDKAIEICCHNCILDCRLNTETKASFCKSVQEILSENADVEPKKRATEESCIVHGMAKPASCRWCRLMREGSRDGFPVTTCSIKREVVNLDQLPDWCPIEEA